jgi:ribosomal-protein-alanine N-acetyltransferase
MRPIGGWSVTLTEPALLDAPVVLRPMGISAVRACREVRAANDFWLRPWEASDPDGQPDQLPGGPPAKPAAASVPGLAGLGLAAFYSRLGALLGTAASWAIWYDGQFAGQVNVFRIAWGPLRSAEVGFWVDERLAGRGIVPTALAMAVDHCFGAMRLHRLEACIQPENAASRRTVEKLGFRNEGLRVGQVHINGAWRDHLGYAITAEETAGGLLPRWRERRHLAAVTLTA